MNRTLIAIVAALITAGAGGVASAQEARTCSQFASQAEAQAAVAADSAGSVGDDEAGDGIACANVSAGDSTTDLTPGRRIGAPGMIGSAGANDGGVGAPGIVPAAQQMSGTAAGGIGAAGVTQTNETSESGVGAAGVTPAPAGGTEGSGTTGGPRDAVVASMTGMPNTGTGVSTAGSWLAPAAFLVSAVAAAWASVWFGTGER